MLEILLSHNPFLSSGLMLMIVGALMAQLRRLPSALWEFAVRRFTISVEIPDRDPAFCWVKAWVAEQRYARRARNLSLTTTWFDPDTEVGDEADPGEGLASGQTYEARFLLSPAPGTHVLCYHGRLLILQRA